MTQRLIVLALAVLASFMAFVAPAAAAEWCYVSEGIEYQNKTIYAGGEYCVPGP
jgi:hypothetical protein